MVERRKQIEIEEQEIKGRRRSSPPQSSSHPRPRHTRCCRLWPRVTGPGGGERQGRREKIRLIGGAEARAVEAVVGPRLRA